ncbi:MAG: GNAT family N-acetyltransferase [Pseudomonadota bacterium]
MALSIIKGDLDHPAVIDLLKFHLETNIAVTPVGSVHALDLGALKTPDIAFFAGWEGDALMVIGAVKDLPSDNTGKHTSLTGEIKSMRTVEERRGQGLGAAMLGHLIGYAQGRGMKRLSLETGSFDYFAPARKLYERHGFIHCEPFGDYTLDPNSVFMTKEL